MKKEKPIVAVAAKLSRHMVSATRKRRRRAVGFAIWLLRLVRDVEMDEACRYSDEIDRLDAMPVGVSRSKYNEVEEEYLYSECALGFLESAIEDLEFAY